MLTHWLQWLRPKDHDTLAGGSPAPPDAERGPTRLAPAPQAQKAQRLPILPATPPDRLFTAEGLERAWLAIKQAGGGAGVDGVTIAKFEANRGAELGALRSALAGGVYRPQPVKQILVPKANGGLRPLALWALRDRVAQRALYDLLAPVFEPTFLPCSFGFRPGQSVQDAVTALAALRDRNLRWVVDADIKDCFDTLPTPRLMGLVKQRVKDRLVLQYVSGWLNARLLNSADGVPRKAGASQGNVLSPLLANIYLHEVDRQVTKRGIAYLRYADDFVVCCRRKEDAEAAFELCAKALEEWGLAVNPRKTRIVHFDEGFTWLGYFFVRRECYRLAGDKEGGVPHTTVPKTAQEKSGMSAGETKQGIGGNKRAQQTE